MQLNPEKHEQVEIIQRKNYAEDLWSIRVKPEHPLKFKPGQYATLGLEVDGSLIEKPYSIVSSPMEEDLEFFFERVPAGELTPPLHLQNVGDTLIMRRQAKGLFNFDEKSGHKNHFLVSTVTGVAPYVSMVRTFARQTERVSNGSYRVVVLQAASRSWEFAYREELDALSKKDAWFYYVPTISRPWEDPSWKGEVGRAEDIVRKYLDDLAFVPANTTTYLCGHPQMIANVNGILQRCGFTKEFIREEIYWVSKKDAN